MQPSRASFDTVELARCWPLTHRLSTGDRAAVVPPHRPLLWLLAVRWCVANGTEQALATAGRTMFCKGTHNKK